LTVTDSKHKKAGIKP